MRNYIVIAYSPSHPDASAQMFVQAPNKKAARRQAIEARIRSQASQMIRFQPQDIAVKVEAI